MLRPILIVDDNPDDVDLLCHALRRSGVLYPVQSFRSGEEAIEHLTELVPTDATAEWLPLLCVLDVKMPGFHGAEVLEWIREQPQLKPVAVMMCSSSDDPKDVREAARRGAQCYARKYPSADDFKMIIQCAEKFTGDRNEKFQVPCNVLLEPENAA